MSKLTQFVSDESGAAAAEYALILALVAVAIIIALTALGGSIANVFTAVSNRMNTATAS